MTQPSTGQFIESTLEPQFLGKFIYFVARRCNFSALGNRAPRITASHATVSRFSTCTRISHRPEMRNILRLLADFLERLARAGCRTKAKTRRCTITLSAINAMLPGVNATRRQSHDRHG